MHIGKKASRKKNRLWWFVSAAVVLGGAIGAIAMLSGANKTNRPDLLLHTVKFEDLDLTVIERGALESAVNKDVVCNVKSTKGGNFSTQIKWIIDDGTQVVKGQHLVDLESAALEDQQQAQKIALTQARSAHIKARGDHRSVAKENAELLLKAENVLRGAELDLEKYLGLPRGTIMKLKPEIRAQYIAELEHGVEEFLTKHAHEFPKLDGEYKQLVDEVNGKIELALAEYEQWKDKASYSQRMVIKGYVTQSQAQADESRLSSATETLKSLMTSKRLLQTFTAQRAVQNLCSILKEAEIAYSRTVIQCEAREEVLREDLEARRQIEVQEKEKLEDIETQIRNCKIYAPQDGMVVYYMPDQSRFGGGSNQSIIAQGEPVRESQKIMRIPNLDKMQVVARVHEATISRIKPDVRNYTGASDGLLAGMLLNPPYISQLVLLNNKVFDDFRRLPEVEPHDFHLVSKGQSATVRVDAYNDRPLRGHVKSVATVASQDYYTSDVKVYQTWVSIDEPLKGLKPGMSAEVTIHVENKLERVLAVPVQAILGGPEQGNKREIFVMTDDGPQKRDIIVGLNNDKMAEIRDGLEEGDRVITNPKVLLGDKAKVREPGEEKTASGKGKGKKKSDGDAQPPADKSGKK